MSLEVEILGRSPISRPEVTRLCELAAGSCGVHDGHLAVEWITSERIAALNMEHRGKSGPTDVLSFPIDGAEDRPAGPRELGDVVVCAEHTQDLREAIVHGVLHLLGMDHEADRGEMLARQAELLSPVSRAGFVALAGRPNVGKSTLTNAVVGEKVAIVSDRPQTTRRAIRGVLSGPDYQLVLVDLPGVQRPRDALTHRMQGSVERELGDADAAVLLINGEEGVGPGDRFIARALLGAPGLHVCVAVNKMDRLPRPRQAQALLDAAELAPEGAEVFPVSARTGAGVAALVEHLASLLPQGPFLYQSTQHSDMGAQEQLAELIREQVLRRTFQEVPHAVGVVVEYVEELRPGLVRIRAVVWVETDSQKGILIGSGGRMIKAVGVASRRALQTQLGEQVHLDLSVRVRRGWRADEGLLDRLGIE